MVELVFRPPKKYFYQIFLVIVPFFSFGDEVGFSIGECADNRHTTCRILLDYIPNAISFPLINFESSCEKTYTLQKIKR